ncbi:MAG TPA: RelA/SpoT domain-containing protein [Candidatus Baltobacteraceae bacterium]|nr:RelA/SpoT domain-containing protein [Candidatus Baltobacteraceae bacterium]
MPYTTPKYDRVFVNKAGDRLRRSVADDDDLGIINNWRAAHAFPLVTFRVTLASRAKAVDSKVIISQRLKRLSSIALKLNRFRNLRLWDIQDIGGCRAVLSSERRARRLFETYCKSGDTLKHVLLWHKNYVDDPKDSGYRGFHLIYGYRGKNPQYDDLRIEIQIRSKLQHAWATAVETVDIFTGQALKSSVGKPEWDDFFRLMASFIARRERKACVPNTPQSLTELRSRIAERAASLNVVDRMRHFRQIAEQFDTEQIQRITGKHPGYFLLQVRPTERLIRITAFRDKDLTLAEQQYLDTERDILTEKSDADAVLVKVDKFINLRKAYPNYYGDTDFFLSIVRDAIGDIKNYPLSLPL